MPETKQPDKKGKSEAGSVSNKNNGENTRQRKHAQMPAVSPETNDSDPVVKAGIQTATTVRANPDNMERQSELLQFGSMVSKSILDLKNTIVDNFAQLNNTLTQSEWTSEYEDNVEEGYSGDDNESGTSARDGDQENPDEPPHKKSRSNETSNDAKETTSKCKVLSTIAEKLQLQEKVDPDIDAELSSMINTLMFKKEKPDEDKLKEKLDLIVRPANCTSLVTTKVDELIWQRLRPQTRSFDSRAQVAQTCVVKSVTLLAKMLDKALTLKDKLPELLKPGINDNPEDALQRELDTLIKDGVDTLEVMSFANYEINARRREYIKPDLNKEYTSLFSASVPINQFLFGGDTSKRLEDIDKTNRVVKKAMGQNTYNRPRQYRNANNSGRKRGRGQRPNNQRQGYTQRHFLGKNSSPSESTYRRPQRGGRGREPKN